MKITPKRKRYSDTLEGKVFFLFLIRLKLRLLKLKVKYETLTNKK